MIFKLDNVEGNPPITIKKKNHQSQICHQESDKENLFSDTQEKLDSLAPRSTEVDEVKERTRLKTQLTRSV